MDVTDDGMLTSVSLVQPINAYLPMDVTDDGMVTDVRPPQQ
jgi:hypothetical protein